MISLGFEFTSELWEFPSEKASWFFVTVPEGFSKDIKAFTKNNRPGFKRVRVSVTVGQSQWLTSLFPDKKTGCYFLPIKKAVRVSESVTKGDDVSVKIEVFI